LKTTGVKLPQQPYRCYNCERKRSATSSPISSRPSCDSSVASSVGSYDSASSMSSVGSDTLVNCGPTSARRDVCKIMSAALPGVAKQPSSTIQYCRKMTHTEKAFAFKCSSSNHYPVPHYATLPAFLPHQDHACPSCQLEDMRIAGDREVHAQALAQYPSLTAEQLIVNNIRQDKWEGKPTLEWYVSEQRAEEKQLWMMVTRKWTQDLRSKKVLVDEEDGLGLWA